MSIPTIIYVEDENGARRALPMLFRSNDFMIRPFASCDEAWPVVKQMLDQGEKPVILSDNNMPGMKGEEMIRAIAASYPADRLPPLLMLSSDQRAAENLQRDGIPVTYLSKPVDIPQVRTAVYNAVRQVGGTIGASRELA